MSQLQDARLKLQAAEQAATAGDFASADQLLREAARIQEAELGPHHPDLASTLNNLAIVAERTGQPRDAEAFYRRAAAIASASLPPDHPMVAASRQNLEDFCRASGLPVDVPADTAATDTAAAETTDSGSDDLVVERTDAPAAGEPKTADVTVVAPAQSSPAPLATPRVPADDSRITSTLAAPRSSRALAWIAVAVVAFIAVALLMTRPWASSDTDAGLLTEDREAAAPPEADGASAPPDDAPVPPADAPAEAAAGEKVPEAATKPPPEAATPPSANPAPPEKERSSVPSRSSGAVTLTVAEVCQTFSPRGAEWRCDPAGDSVAPGRIVLYTRVRSENDTSIVHRWYHDDRLRQTVTLPIRANPTRGYRTYSQQTVGAGGRWRVEVVGADGQVLHEQRFVVR